MKNVEAMVVSSVSPIASKSEFALAINTLSPGISKSPDVKFGKIEINTLSPAASVSQASMELPRVGRVSVAPSRVCVLGQTAASGLAGAAGGEIDALITGELLSEKELLNIDAKSLYKIKLNVMAELFSNPDVKDILKKRVRAALKG